MFIILYKCWYIITIKKMLINENKYTHRLISLNSIDKNIKIVRSNVMIGIRTPLPLLCMCVYDNFVTLSI